MRWDPSETGYLSTVDPIVMSPNGRWFVSVLVYGDIIRNGVWFEIIGAETTSVAAAANVRTIHRFFSPMLGAADDLSATDLTNPGRNPLRWMNAESITLLWTDDRQVRQVVRVHVPTGRVDQLTHSSTHVEYYEWHDDKYLVYAARAAANEEESRRRLHDGFVVDVPDAYSLARYWVDEMGALGREWDCQWYLKADGGCTRIDVNGLGRDLCGVNNSLMAAFSPDGESMLITDTAATVPPSWDRFQTGIVGRAIRDYRVNGRKGLYARLLKQVFLFNIRTNQSRAVVDAPFISLPRNGMLWSPSGGSFIVGPMQLLVDADSGTQSLVVGSSGDSTVRQIPITSSWKTALTPGRSGLAEVAWTSDNELRVSDGHIAATYHRRGEAWDQVSIGAARVEPAPRATYVKVVQTMNSPPVFVAGDAVAGTERPILDPNPQLKHVELARAEDFDWQDYYIGSGATGLDR